MKMWNRCRDETGMTGNLPATEADILTYVAWLLKRNLNGSSIDSYLAGIRAAHLSKGMNPPQLRTSLIKAVIAGKTHSDQAEKRAGKKRNRLPVTPTMLKILKQELYNSSLCKLDKLAAWSAATLIYFGCMRPGEVLCRNVKTFDPDYSLLNRDMKEKVEQSNNTVTKSLQIFLKSDKTDRQGKGRLIDIYSCNSGLCPVKAFRKYKNAESTADPGKPVFRLQSGKPYTTSTFNKHLKLFLGKHVDTESAYVSGHSLRAGIASLAEVLGYSETEIKEIGRWSSDAFSVYLKLPSSRRAKIARELAQLNL